MFYWLLYNVLIGPWIRMVWRPKVTGLEHVPPTGPLILAGNHLSYVDWLFVPAVLPRSRRVIYAAKSDYFVEPGLKGWLKKQFFAQTAVPIDRSGGKASEGALRTGMAIVGKGKVFGIFPEGTRAPDPHVYRGKTGVARLALESGARVLPVGVAGTERVVPPGKKFPKLIRVSINFGEPIDFSRFAARGEDPQIRRAITDEIMNEIARLSGLEYVDFYASEAKRIRTDGGQEALDAATTKAEHRPSGAIDTDPETSDGLEFDADDGSRDDS